MQDIDKQVEEIFDAVNRNKKRFAIGAAAVWLSAFAVGAGFVGVVIWAVVRLVLHFT